VTLRATAKPGRNGAALSAGDLKHSRDKYVCTSRESPRVFWIESLSPGCPAVKAYQARKKEEYPDQYLSDQGDIFESFASLLTISESSKAQLVARAQLPTNKLQVGRIFPLILEYTDRFTYVCGMLPP
jgi:hypothetical protein